MKTSVLLIATTTQGLGPARMPKALFDAGFEVSLLAPANSLAEKSRFIARVGHLPDAVDLPWEEPDLIEAMIALRRG